EDQCIAVFQVWLNVLGEDGCLGGIRCQDGDNVCPLGCFCNRLDFKASSFSRSFGLGTVTKADEYLNAGVAQVRRERVALGAVANNSDLAALDDRQISIVVVKSLNCHER